MKKMTRFTNYAKAVLNWYQSGKPIRTDEDVSELLEICKQCEHYHAEKSFCKICGCNLNLSRNALFNKLRMKTEHCPIGKW